MIEQGEIGLLGKLVIAFQDPLTSVCLLILALCAAKLAGSLTAETRRESLSVTAAGWLSVALRPQKP